MRILLLLVPALLISCGAEPKPAAEPPAKPAAAKPSDETRRFPSANQVNTEVVDTQLLGKSFMPGGTLAHYKHGKQEYMMFIVKMPNPQDAAFLLLDWNKTLKGSQIVPAFGGYCGDDAGRTVFVFAKDRWVAGVVGLPQKEADLAARGLAAHLD